MGKGKKFLSSSLLFLILLMGAFFLIYKFIVPVLMKQVIEDGLAKGLKKDVSLERVDFSLLRGMELHRLFIYEPGTKKIFLQAKEVKVDYHIDEILENLRSEGKDFRKWQLNLKASSPETIFWGFRLENLSIPFRFEGSKLIIEDLKAKLYGGNLKGSYVFNFGAAKKNYRFQAALSRIDLSKLRRKANSSPKKLEGILFASINLQGIADGSKNLSGSGKVSVVKGKLLEFPLLGNLMAIFRIPSLEKIVFRKGKANFTISKDIVTTKDLTLISDQVKLSAKGSIDFHGYFRPSFVYKISFSKGFLGEVPLIGNIISSVIDEAGYLIAQVELTGSLKKPKFKLVPLVRGLKDFFGKFGFSTK
ncbi:MAG: AsmA-like C-terminal region-containing protein [Nitrospirae bacterium]|nr:AsmA-like C-terminal region-containing protein [Nitrospirota bacterium]